MLSKCHNSGLNTNPGDWGQLDMSSNILTLEIQRYIEEPSSSLMEPIFFPHMIRVI